MLCTSKTISLFTHNHPCPVKSTKGGSKISKDFFFLELDVMRAKWRDHVTRVVSKRQSNVRDFRGFDVCERTEG